MARQEQPGVPQRHRSLATRHSPRLQRPHQHLAAGRWPELSDQEMPAGWLGRHRSVVVEVALRASLSGTFPPNPARFGYATEGALDLYLRAAVHRRGQRPPKGLGTDKIVEAT